MKRAMIGSITAVAVAAIAIPLAVAQQNPPSGRDRQQQTLAAPQAAVPKLTPDEIRHVQQALNRQGFDAGHVDGIMGSETRTALHNFQKARGMQPSGTADRPTLSALGVRISQDEPQESQGATTGQGSRNQNQGPSPGPAQNPAPARNQNQPPSK